MSAPCQLRASGESPRLNSASRERATEAPLPNPPPERPASAARVLFARPQRQGEEVKVSLRLPAGEPLQCEATVIESKPQAGNAHVSFRFRGVSEADVERIETLVFDAVLEQLK